MPPKGLSFCLRATLEGAHHSLLLLFRFRTDIERIHRLGVRFDEFRYDEYTWNRLLDDVHDGRFGLRSLNNHCFGLRRL